MRYLVNTHILIWMLNDPSQIGDDILTILENEDKDVYFSQISLWEISIKYGLGKLDLRGHTPEEFFRAVEQSFLHCLLLENEDMISAYQLQLKHRDPFDRMLVWQCIRGDVVLLSADNALEAYEKDGLRLIVNA
jgi:PIN domain nuclease of toxin-antitoxin system